MQGSKLTDSTSFAISNSDESGSAAGSPPGMVDSDWGFTELSLI